jgi:ABC-2 type transport system ATP-binding protein
VLSRGQKQRLGVARALVHKPSVLLLDEPASGLDPRSRVELRDLLRAQAHEGAAVLVSSHILTELEEIADRVVFVDQGITVSEHQMRELSSTRRAWRLRTLGGDGAAADALVKRGLTNHAVSTIGIDVELNSEQEAADLLSGLVSDGVPVLSFAPVGSHLESAYLAFTEERR